MAEILYFSFPGILLNKFAWLLYYSVILRNGQVQRLIYNKRLRRGEYKEKPRRLSLVITTK